MTQDEAKKRWCPFTRVALRQGLSANRTASKGGYADIADETRCVASGCMAWQWTGHNAPNGESEGYCGLARKP